jgi:hypothetical protein
MIATNKSLLGDKEYEALSSRPFSELTRLEFARFDREYRRRTAGIGFRYNRKDFIGPEYTEKCFLSCVISGAAIPGGITPQHFTSKKHRIIFTALRGLQSLGLIYARLGLLITYLSKTKKLAAIGSEKYIRGIERMIGIPSAIDYYAKKIRKQYAAKEKK